MRLPHPSDNCDVNSCESKWLRNLLGVHPGLFWAGPRAYIWKMLEVPSGASREAHENSSEMVGSSMSPPPAGSSGVVLRAPSRFSRGRASPTGLNDGDDRE